MLFTERIAPISAAMRVSRPSQVGPPADALGPPCRRRNILLAMFLLSDFRSIHTGLKQFTLYAGVNVSGNFHCLSSKLSWFIFFTSYLIFSGIGNHRRATLIAPAVPTAIMRSGKDGPGYIGCDTRASQVDPLPNAPGIIGFCPHGPGRLGHDCRRSVPTTDAPTRGRGRSPTDGAPAVRTSDSWRGVQGGAKTTPARTIPNNDLSVYGTRAVPLTVFLTLTVSACQFFGGFGERT